MHICEYMHKDRENVKNLRNDYAEALKQAIAMRRDGTIDWRTDRLLGDCLYSVAQWVISDSIAKGKLYREQGADPDFNSHVLLCIVSAVDKVDLSRTAREIIVYLKNAGRTDGVSHYTRALQAQCRSAETVAYDEAACSMSRDFFGNIRTVPT